MFRVTNHKSCDILSADSHPRRLFEGGYRTYTLSSGEGWSKTFNLPKTGTSGGNTVNYVYLIREHDIENYSPMEPVNDDEDTGIVFTADSANVTLKNKKDFDTGDLKIVKNFTPANPTLTDPTKLVFKVYGPYTNTDNVPADLTDETPIKTVSYDQFTGGSYTFKELRLGTYAVVESGHDATGANVLIEHYHFVDASSTTSTKAVLSDPDAEVIVTLTNVYEEDKGALKLKKTVTVNGSAVTEDNRALMNGDYVFTITGPDTVPNVTIHMENGEPAYYKLGSDATQYTNFEDGYVVIGDLTKGDYVITEQAVNGVNVAAITGGKGDGDTDARTVTVHVSPSDTAAAENDAHAEYKNNRYVGDLTIRKVAEGTTSEDEGDEFTFSVALTAPEGVTLADSYAVVKKHSDETPYDSPESMSVSEGSITGITLKAGETFTIKGLPGGTR